MKKIILLNSSDFGGAYNYIEIKNQYNTTLNELKEKYEILNSSIPPIENLLKQDLNKLMTLDQVFKKGEIEDKRSLIQILYTEKLLFYGTLMQSTKLNNVLQFIYQYKTKN